MWCYFGVCFVVVVVVVFFLFFFLERGVKSGEDPPSQKL